MNIVIASAEEMRALGVAIAAALASTGSDDAAESPTGRPVVLAIEGDLGAGKTTLVGGVLNGLGIRGPIRSPTYTLVEPYELAGRPVYHLDLYRLADPREVEALAVRDLLSARAVLLIEWPSKGAGYLPQPDLELNIHYLPPPIEAGESHPSDPPSRKGLGRFRPEDQPRSLSIHPRSAVGHKLLQNIVAALR